MSRIEKIIKDATEKVIKEAVFHDWKHWYNEDFESDIYVDEEMIINGELTDDDIEMSQSDFIQSIIVGYMGNVCEILGLNSDTYLNHCNYHEELLEEVYEIVKEELRKQFRQNREVISK